jgi:hypothetical protein
MGIPPQSGGVPPQISDYNRHYGNSVVTADGVTIGTFDQVMFAGPPGQAAPYLLVKTGPLGGRFHTDALYIPTSVVEQLGPKQITLKVPEHEIEEHDWVKAPLGADRW